MSTILLNLEINDFWSKPYLNANEITNEFDSNNNDVIVCNNLTESSLIKLSTDCLDLNYKSRRQHLADVAKLKKNKIQDELITTKIIPILNKFDLLSQVYTLEDFTFESTLGQGSFGKVYQAYFNKKNNSNNNNNNNKLAIKIIPLSKDTESKNYLRSYVAEQNVKNLKHPNLIAQLGAQQFDKMSSNAFIIYEYGGRMNLNQFIFNTDLSLHIGQRKHFCIDLVRALEFIHANHIVHMDLKPANVIVTDSFNLKLTDFGCSIKLIDDNDNNNNDYVSHRWTAGTWFYRAPELFKADKLDAVERKQSVTTKCDIYSLGVLMWQLLTRDSPYHNENPHVIIYQIVTNLRRPEFPNNSNIEDDNCDNNSVLNLKRKSNCLEYSNNKHVCATNNNNNKKPFNHLTNLNIDNHEIECQKRKMKINLEFERVFRMLIEKCWNNDPNVRLNANQIREILTNTKISYS